MKASILPFAPLFAPSIADDSFLIPTSNLLTSAPLWSAAYFQRCNSSLFTPVRSDSLSIKSAVSAVLVAKAIIPPIATVPAPATAAPNFTAFPTPERREFPVFSACSSV